MNRKMPIACLAMIAVMASGCSTVLANQGRADLVEQCAEMGENMRFLPRETRKSDNPLFSSASVQGECIGPDHPEYEDAIVPDE